MAVFNGTEFKARLVGSPDKEIADTRDLSISISNEELDVTTRDSGGWKRTLAGVRSWTASISGIVNFTEAAGKAGIKSMLALSIAREEVELEFGTSETGDLSFTGKGLIMDVSPSFPHEGVCEWTMEISGNGPIEITPIA